MRTQTLTTLVALASTASATYDWNHASPFTCPSNTDNHCIPSQNGGFSWGGLNLGDFSNFGDFDFSGWSCASSFGGSKKRDQLTGRTFQDKCITGSASHEVHNCPSFSCDSSKDVDKFSVDEFQISVEFDCDLQFHYGMPGGGICKQTSSCSKHGTTVKNTQCGGAHNVTVVYPTGGSNGGKPSKCSIGVHSIGFDCNSASSTIPPKTSTTPPSYSTTTPPAYTTTTEATTTPYSESSPPAETTPTSSYEVPTTTPEVPTTTPEETPTSSYEVPSSTPEVPTTTPEGTPTSSYEVPTTTPEGTPTSSYEVPSSTPEVPTTTPEGPSTTSEVPTTYETPSTTPESSPVPTSSAEGSTTYTPGQTTTTVVVETSTTVCPVTLTHTTGGTTSIEIGVSTSTILVTNTHTVCDKCEHPTTAPVPTSTPEGVVTTSTTPSGPAPTAPCPEVLPQCLSTWMFSAGCGSNTDASCYCPSSEFVCNVFECLSAHGASDDEVASAQSYFQGICAPYVTSNPAVVTCAPNPTITAGGVPTDVPVTTIQVFTTVYVQCSQSGTAIPDSSTQSVLSTVITVPQVIFQTITGSTTASAALVVGTPAPAEVPAGATTAGYPAATTISTIAVSNGTIAATAPPSQFTGASSRTTAAFSTLFAAVLFAVLAM